MLDERTTEDPAETPATPDEAAPNGRAPEAEAPEATTSEAPVTPAVTSAPEELAPPAQAAEAPAADAPAPDAAEAGPVAAETPAATAAPEEASPAPGIEDAAAAALDVPAMTPAATSAPEQAAPTGEAPQRGRQPAGQRRAPRQRDPLPWPELRSAAGAAAEGAAIDDLKELFRLLPNDVRDETVEGVREYRKGARRPVSAYAGKSLARAVHTARRARRRPDSDEAVSEALGQALAAEIIASLDVEIAAEVILPKRDLLEREARNARRRQRDEDVRSRDERRRRAREQGSQGSHSQGTYSGAKIRGLDQLKKLFDEPEDAGG